MHPIRMTGLWHVCALVMGVLATASPVVAQPFAYVANQNLNTVSVIDTATNAIVATVPTGNRPVGMVITPDGAGVYVTNLFSNDVSVIDTASNTLIATIPNAGGDPFGNPFGIAITPDGARLYVTGGGRINVIDTATNTVLNRLNIGASPLRIAITPDGTRAYISSLGNVIVLDIATHSITAIIAVSGSDPLGDVAFTPDGSRAYVANSNARTVHVIDTITNTVLTTVTFTGNPGGVSGIAITPDGTTAYVAHANNQISLIDTTSNAVTQTISTPGSFFGLAFTPDGSRLFATSPSFPALPSISVIDTNTKAVLSTIGPFASASAPAAIVMIPGASVPTGPFSITFDATGLDTANYNLNFSGTLGGENVVTTFDLTPGSYTFHSAASSGTAFFPFTVTNVGTVNFDPIYDILASGRGTSTLTVTGLPITIDATTLDTASFNLNFSTTLGGANVVRSLRILPGNYIFQSPASSSTAQIPFTFTFAGTVDFDPIYDILASGRGTSTLTVTGLPLTIDATGLDISQFNLNFSFTLGGANVVRILRILPGDYFFQAPASSSTAQIPFTFNFAGTVDFNPFFDPIASGRGTNTLTVTGFPITVDATGSSESAFNINFGVAGTELTSVVRSFRWIPGDYTLRVPASSSTGVFPFVVTTSGTIDFDPSLDNILSGRGTDMLIFGIPAVTNTPPLADAVVEQLTNSGVGAQVRLDASGSSDLESPLADLIFEWFVDGVPVCNGSQLTCQTIEESLSFGVHTVILRVTDPDGAFDEVATTVTLDPAELTVLTIDKVKVKFDHNPPELEIKGTVGLPLGVNFADVLPLAMVSLDLAANNLLTNETILLIREANEPEEWEYRNESIPLGIRKFDIDWKGARFKFDEDNGLPLELKSHIITPTETVLTFKYEMENIPSAFSMNIGGLATVNVDASGGVTADVPFVVEKPGKEIDLTLPFGLNTSMVITLTGSLNASINVADHYKPSIGRFRLKAAFDAAAFPLGSATAPRQIDLSLLLGAQFYPGQAALGPADLKVDGSKWKRKKDD